MSILDRRRLGGLLAGFLLVLATTLAPADQAQHPGAKAQPSAGARAQHATGAKVQRRLAQAADITFQKGFHAVLPPHISTLLGLAKDEERPVMQNVVRTGTLIQGFDVSVKDRKDIIIFVVDESTKGQHLYLTSPEGTLRKEIQVKSGVGDMVPITDKEKEAFQKERDFWLDRLVPAPAASAPAAK